MSLSDAFEVLAGSRRYAVIHGDCLEVIPALPTEARTIVAADPPYGYGHYKTDRDITAHMLAAVAGWKTLALKGYAQDLHSWLMDAGIREVTEWCVWYPTNATCKAGGRSKGLPHYHEDWAVCGLAPGRGRLTRERSPRVVRDASMAQSSHRGANWTADSPARMGDVWTDAAPACAFQCHARMHPNEMALGVALRLVELISNPGDCIFDPFAGSFSLGVAAIRLGRRYIGVEIDQAWADQGRDRLAAESEGSTLQARRAGQVPLFGAR